MVECSLFLQQPELLDYLRKKNIVMQASSVLVDSIPDQVKSIATLSKHTVEEVMVRYLCQKGIQVITPTSSTANIISPSKLIFSINTNESKVLASLDKRQRQFYCKMTATVENKYYPKSWTREPGFAEAWAFLLKINSNFYFNGLIDGSSDLVLMAPPRIEKSPISGNLWPARFGCWVFVLGKTAFWVFFRWVRSGSSFSTKNSVQRVFL